VAECCVGREPEAAHNHPDLLHEHHPATIERICDRSSDDGQRQEWDEVRERDEADCQRRAGQLVDLVGQRNFGDLRADERNALPEPEPPERRKAAQRRDVERESRSSLPQAPALGRSDPWFVRQDSLSSSVPKPKTIITVASATCGIIAVGNAERGGHERVSTA
jgi:hypothetical protein